MDDDENRKESDLARWLDASIDAMAEAMRRAHELKITGARLANALTAMQEAVEKSGAFMFQLTSEEAARVLQQEAQMKKVHDRIMPVLQALAAAVQKTNGEEG